jgi:hypothetical protein
MKKRILIIGLIFLLALSIGSVAESKTRVFIGPWFGWWGHSWVATSGRIDSGRFFVSTSLPFWLGYPGVNLFFTNKIDGRIAFSASLPLWWNSDYRYYQPYGYYYPYYGRVIVNDPNPVKDPYFKTQDPTLNQALPGDRAWVQGQGKTQDTISKDQDTIFYGGIQIHPAGRIKITAKGSSGVPEIADIEIDGLPAGKIGEKPFEMGLLIGKHKVTLKKDGKEVFSAEVDIERNKEVSLKIDL